MSDRDRLRAELVSIIATHKEGFASGTPESKRIDELIDALAPLTPYPNPMDHAQVFRGHWSGDYFNFGKLVGGSGSRDQGVGVTVSLKEFSMGRLPDIPATFMASGLEIEPESGAYNFVSQFALGHNRVPSYHFAFAFYRRKEEQLDRFFVDFAGFRVAPVDQAMPMAEFADAIGVDDPALLSAELNPRAKLWSRVVYMDDDLRIQLGQLGGHYILLKTDRPMYSLDYWKPGARVTPMLGPPKSAAA
ncbi:MAG: hypothetical protein SFV21_12815 [Rhodospirillaceae bacterium]|nr:hypothetical protein [Rhodospirillaceae bacterium]